MARHQATSTRRSSTTRESPAPRPLLANSPGRTGFPMKQAMDWPARGQRMDASTRATFEPRFGHDFSRVRIHADEHAASAARSLNAEAFTHGSDIAFGPGTYAPHNDRGQRLLAHELAHVVQQGTGARTGGAATTLSHPTGPAEREAAHVAALASGPGPLRVGHHVPPSMVMRQPATTASPDQREPVAESPAAVEATSWYDGTSQTGHVASIYFPTNVAGFGADDMQVIGQLRFLLGLRLQQGPATLKVIGYADYRGRERYNHGLSERRAIAVAEQFERYAAYPNLQSEIYGFGESEAPQIGTTAGDLAPYRRVDVIVLPPAPAPIPEQEPEPIPQRDPYPVSDRWMCRIVGSAGGGIGPAGVSFFYLEVVDLTNNLRMYFQYRGGLAGLAPGLSAGLSGASPGTSWQEFTTSIPLHIRDFEGPARHTSGGVQLGRGPAAEYVHILGTVAHGADSVYLAWEGLWEEGWSLGAGTDVGPLEAADDPEPVPAGYR